MSEKIQNQFNNVKIENFIQGNNFVFKQPNPEEKKQPKEKKDTKKKVVFLSHNSEDTRIADRIEKHLSYFPEIVVKKYENDVGDWESFEEFMKSIRQDDYAIFLISDVFLKSDKCMFEVLEMMKEQAYQNKIFPAVIEREIYKPLGRIKYIRYWEQECKKLEDALKKVEIANSVEVANNLKCYKKIALSISEFLNKVADMNNPDIGQVEFHIEKVIREN